MAQFGEHSTGRQKVLITGGPDTMIEQDNDTAQMKKRFIVSGDALVISDGYHTIDELYDHRITLFLALCRHIKSQEPVGGFGDSKWEVWRSKSHADGTMFDRQFILGIGKEPGKQITYHLPLHRWSETDFAETLDKAPVWDGHTPDDVLERLKAL